MPLDQQLLNIHDTFYTTNKIIAQGYKPTEESIAILGRIIQRSKCAETITACEKLIEALNEAGSSSKIYQLTEKQSKFAATIIAAVHDCATLTV